MTLSVVVIEFTGRAQLEHCLAALSRQEGVPAPEILLPHDDAFADAAGLARRFPGVRLVAVAGRRTPAELRARGVAAAHGDVIALVEDHCTPDADWCARILAAHEAPHAGVGGAVEKGQPPGGGRASALDWAVYLADYSRYMNPQPAGPAHGLTDTNSSYKRAALEPIRDAWATEFHENIVNGLLRERGATLWMAPDIVVREHRPLTMAAALRDRYAFGRLFASTRVAGVPVSRRLVRAGAAVLLPPVLVMRVARNLFGRRRHRLQWFRCLPQLLLVTGVWMAGEMVGYLTARPGAALATGAAAQAHGAGTAAPAPRR